jgi:hypothetical protein
MKKHFFFFDEFQKDCFSQALALRLSLKQILHEIQLYTNYSNSIITLMRPNRVGWSKMCIGWRAIVLLHGEKL